MVLTKKDEIEIYRYRIKISLGGFEPPTSWIQTKQPTVGLQTEYQKLSKKRLELSYPELTARSISIMVLEKTHYIFIYHFSLNQIFSSY